MGKFQSKHAPRRRQSPEGGSQRELERSNINKTKLTENLYVELRKNKSDHNFKLKVVRPLKKTPDRGTNVHSQVRKQTKKRMSHVDDTTCTTGPQDERRQEWVFTLNNFDNTGKVSKEEMSSLIHSMYEALEASVKQPDCGTTPLKIRLVVTPSPCSVPQKATEKEQSVSQEAGRSARGVYCVDENIERRNHYLDLAGIENYSSKFENPDTPSQDPSKAPSALRHHIVVFRGNCLPPESPRQLSIVHSLKNKVMSVGKDRNRGERRSFRLHGQHPASWCHPTQTHLPTSKGALQRSHSKRLHCRVQDAASPSRHPGFQAQPGREKEIFSNLQPSCEIPLTQRHEHRHHHEHHHHHHHYHPS